MASPSTEAPRAQGAHYRRRRHPRHPRAGSPGHRQSRRIDDDERYILMGLAADRHPADAATDALVRLIVTRQLPDGRWAPAYRPPSESSEFTAAAVSLRGIQLYGTATPPQRRAVRSGSRVARSAPPQSTEDRVFKLLGLDLGGRSTGRSAVGDSGSACFATHRRRLGPAALRWRATRTPPAPRSSRCTQPASVPGDAGVSPRHQFLLETQLADGSWFVPTRVAPDADLLRKRIPARRDQFISAAATNWATQALILADPARPTTSPASTTRRAHRK